MPMREPEFATADVQTVNEIAKLVTERLQTEGRLRKAPLRNVDVFAALLWLTAGVLVAECVTVEEVAANLATACGQLGADCRERWEGRVPRIPLAPGSTASN